MLSFDQLHELLDDEMLDRLAERCGFSSGIGRLSFTPDRILNDFLRRLPSTQSGVLDLGCGRGFLGRWLERRAPGVAYAGIDFSSVAIAHARLLVPHAEFFCGDYRNFAPETREPFDVLAMFDSLFSDFVDDAFARQCASLLRRDGVAYIAVSALSSEHARLFYTSVDGFKRAGFTVEIQDWTSRVELEALSAGAAWLSEQSWPPGASELFRAEAARMIEAVEQRSFSYLTLCATRVT